MKMICNKCGRLYIGKDYMLSCEGCAKARAKKMGITLQTLRYWERREYKENRNETLH